MLLEKILSITKQTIMTTLAKFSIGIIIGLLFVSCNFDANWDMGVNGNGNVITTQRNANEEFTKIKASRGLNVYITQSNEHRISVEADENLQDLITTTIENGTLKITSEKNIGSASSKKIIVSLTNIELVSANSGSAIYVNSPIKAKNLALATSSGADIEIEVEVENLDCSSSSGSDIKVSGTAKKLTVKASSGAVIKAGRLISEKCTAIASSGGDISVNTSKELTVKASSGGDITYYGNPEKLIKNGAKSGKVRKG